ncbi:MAG: LysE family transporter [Pseudomonadota bacterium]
MESQTWIIYLAAVIGLSLTPGPNGLLALSHGALYGYKKALFTVAGGVIGFVALIALSMFGIGALLRAVSGALTLLKCVGAIYLILLGIQIWRAPSAAAASIGHPQDRRGTVMFRQGLLAAMSNPKVLLFFSAFLPQFIDARRELLPQFMTMAVTFAIVEFSVECMLARLAHRIRPRMERGGKRFNQFCGGLFVAMGAALFAQRT